MKIEIKDERSISTKNQVDFIFDVTVKYVCNTFEITNDSTYIGRQSPVIIDHGSDKTITMSFNENLSLGHGCILTYALDFYNDSTRVWEPFSAATHTFVKAGTFTSAAGSFTIDADYDSHKWSTAPNHTIIARLSVTAPETASSNNYVAEEFEIVIQELCRLVTK